MRCLYRLASVFIQRLVDVLKSRIPNYVSMHFGHLLSIHQNVLSSCSAVPPGFYLNLSKMAQKSLKYHTHCEPPGSNSQRSGGGESETIITMKDE